MKNQIYPAWKHALTYGLYLGAGTIVLSLIFYILDLYGEQWTGYVSYFLVLGAIILSSLHYRDKYLGGFISYGNSVSVGFLTGLFGAAIASVFTFIFITYLGESYTALMLEKAEESILNSQPDISDEELDLALNMSKRMMKPWWLSVIVLISYLFFSIIFALITSIFIKKEDNSIESNT